MLLTYSGYGSFPTEGCIPDTVNEPPAKSIRDLYERVDDTLGELQKLRLAAET